MTAMVEHGAGNVAHATIRELDPKEVDLKEVQYVFFERFIHGCIDASGSEIRFIFQGSSRSTVAAIGRKKSASTFLLPKKKNTQLLFCPD